MLNSNIPAKFTIPWGKNAGAGYINAIPTNSQIGIVQGAASLNDGFPPLCFTAVGAGGIPPFGKDFNGILNWITLWGQWYQAGGALVYDSTFSTSIGGYPQGAILSSLNTLGAFWLNTVDNNTSNPDTGGANWTQFFSPTNLQLLHFGTDTGAVNALVATVSPPVTSLKTGMVFIIIPANTNTGAATIAVGGGTPPIIRTGGAALTGGELAANVPAAMIYDGASMRLINAAATTTVTKIYATPGTYTFTPPLGVSVLDEVIVTGGGGGGGGNNSSSSSAASGGAGATAIDSVSVTPLTGYTVIVGAAGSGGSASNNGTTGGTSSAFGLSAVGGLFGCGSGAANISGGSGGTASGGSANARLISGGWGSDGLLTANTPALGGASYWGGGTRSAPSTGPISAVAAYGSGGGACYSGSGSGVAGVPGIVVIKYRV